MVSRNHNRIRIRAETSNAISFILLVCLVAVHSQEGTISGPTNITSSPPPVTTNAIASKGYQKSLPDISKVTESVKRPENVVGITYMTLVSICLTISSLALGLIYSYLNTVGLAKESILLYLYQNFVVIWGLFHCVWISRTIMTYFNKDIEAQMNPSGAMTLAFVSQTLTIAVLLQMIIIAIIKAYRTKHLMLDPPMPWGMDDQKGTMILQTICSITSLGLTSVGFILKQYPYWFFYFLGIDASRKQLNGNKPFLDDLNFSTTVNSILTYTYIACWILGKYHQTEKNETSDNSIPMEMDDFSGVASIVLVFISSIRFLLSKFDIVSMEMIRTSDEIRLQVVQIIFLLVFSVPPVWILIRSGKIRCSAVKTMKTLHETIFFLNIYLTPLLITLLMYPCLCLLYNVLDM